jgi:plasmid stabilization system protein ParE
MSRSLRFLARARADIDRIFGWLDRRSPQGAATWYDALFEAVGRIVEAPDSYPVAAESLSRWNRRIHQALFKTPRGNRYRIVFELTETDIRILRVRGPGQPPLRRRDLPTE